MKSKWLWLIIQFARTLWVRTTLFAVLALVAALAGLTLEGTLHRQVPVSFGADSVGRILEIMASTMLAVTTFSLSVMVSAYRAASEGVSPRATRLLMQDTTTQTVLATFVGSFIFSLVGIIALGTGLYGRDGRFVLFVFTLFVVGMVIVAILRWIEHLNSFGRVNQATEEVEEMALKAIRDRIAHPCLGGRPAMPARPQNSAAGEAGMGVAITARDTGYVQHVDVKALSECAEEVQAHIHLVALPGKFVYPSQPLAWSDSDDSKIEEAVHAAITVARERSFDQDPRFGLAVLSEIASKALSPAVNDPGTAIDIIGRSVRIFAEWVRQGDEFPEPLYPRISVPPLATRDLFDDVFRPLARDAGGNVEVHIRLQKALAAIARQGGQDAVEVARSQSLSALARARTCLAVEEDVRLLEGLVAELFPVRD